MNKIVACFGWKYEPEWMVEDLKKNLSWVDDFAILDCRARDELWIHEGDYRLLLREMAFEKKADWILITSPDERWEKDAGEKIRKHTDNHHGKHILEFDLRELFHPLWYRVDGIWGGKKRRRAYPVFPDQRMAYQSIQYPSMPQNAEYEIVPVDVNIYHLKMIEPENRTNRVKVFKALDPDNKFQGVGYDYLDDEVGSVVERIPEGRMYYPEYKKYTFTGFEKYL